MTPTDRSLRPASAGTSEPRRIDAPPRVLLLTDYFWPAKYTGGPVRVLTNTVRALGDRMRFRVLASHADDGPNPAMDALPAARWTRFGRARAMYVPGTVRGALLVARTCVRARGDVIYLNSIFSRPYSMLPLLLNRLGLLRGSAVVVAPRGEFGAAALAIKPRRKRVYLALARALGLFEGVRFQVTCDGERDDLARVLGVHADPSSLVPDLGLLPDGEAGPREGEDGDGALRVVFLGRIARIKGLADALAALREVRARVDFDIHGPVSEPDHWRDCEAAIGRLPPNVRVRWHGPCDPADVHALLRRYDLFYCPTHGENFGHAIFEALGNGVPVLISDRTPWTGVGEAGAGWAIDPSDHAAQAAAIERLAATPPAERLAARLAARNFARESVERSGAAQALFALLTSARETAPSPRPTARRVTA
ncbi:MAG: glycosyltransferase [Burkholderiales bacterium]|jgi:glycosyltransferase involved in cell wall biosynthesis